MADLMNDGHPQSEMQRHRTRFNLCLTLLGAIKQKNFDAWAELTKDIDLSGPPESVANPDVDGTFDFLNGHIPTYTGYYRQQSEAILGRFRQASPELRAQIQGVVGQLSSELRQALEEDLVVRSALGNVLKAEPYTPPSGDQPRSINPDAVSALLEGGALVTESELSALAESRGQQRPPAAYVPRLPSGKPIDTTNARFDMNDPLNWMSGDGCEGAER